MNIVLRDLASLREDPLNARRHSQRNLDAIAASLEKFGQRRAAVVRSDGTVLAGNGMLAAARRLGWDRLSVTIVPDGWSDDEARAFALADNRTAELAEWDQQVLLEYLVELDLAGWDLEKFGFDAPEVAREGLTDPDDVPDAPAVPVTKPGDLWLLGEHRVVCGDSATGSGIAEVMREDYAELVWTDPPYGVAYVGKTKDALTIQNDTLDPSRLAQFLRDAFDGSAAHCVPGACWYVAAPAGPLFLPFAQVLSDLDIWRQTLVWAKDVLVMGRSDYHYRHEAIFYGWTPGAAHSPPPDRKQDTILEFARPKRSKEHPTMKPVKLIEYCIGNSSKRGGIVLDPFGGSGSTLIAAHRTGRAARLVELDPAYVDVICRRYQEHTGDEPVLDATGEPHDFVSDADG